jgi:hypothetical protein
VLDVDGEEGEQSLRRLEDQHGALPPTRQVITPRGGRHCLFKHVDGVPCSAGKIGQNLDVRSGGGYVVVAPSIGQNGRRYSWVDGTIETAIAPAWLIELARKKPISEQAVDQVRARRPLSPDLGAYGRAALTDEIETLAATPRGQRNDALNRAAFRLFQLVAGGELDQGEVTEQLINACERNGLIHDDGRYSVIATIRSARAGMQYPRSRE